MKTLKLNNGVEMPQIGYGVFQVSPAECEVALRWLFQRDVIIIPKSSHIERMRQNIDIFDFSLSKEDMDAIAGLDTGKSLFFDHHDAETTKMFMSWK